MSYTINIPTPSVAQSTTCLTCAIRLPSLESQQQHHKSDWHTYNLKRKMVYLPPVSAEVFAQLVNTSREQANPVEVPQPECVPCGKKYLSFQSYDNHLNSKKHKQTVSAYEKKQQQQQQQQTSSSTSEGDTDTKTTKEVVEQLEPSEVVCLFCSHEATDAISNYEHMRATHGFFLPSFERLIDLPGMLTYLSEKLVENYDCLWCTPSVFSQNLDPDQELHSGFSSLASVRRHMTDKGHCKLAMDQGAEREYADFYLTLDDEQDDIESHEYRESLEDSVMDTDENMDEDQKRLNMVLLDEDGNWILDSQNVNSSGIQVDPVTNELVLNNRRLAHKDAARRQKVESRTVTLISRSQHNAAASSETEGEATESTTESGVSTTNNPHQPGLKVSSALLKSQNQLSGSSLALTSSQLAQAATKIAKAQGFESTKRERMATRLGTNNNYTARRRCNMEYGMHV
ncbi:hypothetical protein BGX21_006541 [Mortierella sp. AD011]|nr:hypothetical protein BGX20_007248 [Mortierella sp. AD010]KAF9403175.1 hypothetical protein BGX21_006541 [Mortierella sp. AD011]